MKDKNMQKNSDLAPRKNILSCNIKSKSIEIKASPPKSKMDSTISKSILNIFNERRDSNQFLSSQLSLVDERSFNTNIEFDNKPYQSSKGFYSFTNAVPVTHHGTVANKNCEIFLEENIWNINKIEQPSDIFKNLSLSSKEQIL
ncbi:hypothetical protein AYI70_g10590 [Smittium culicis]|uniref:Uncharacterized protein n=1 Tax=Smittium culicis TaxID=133412 RepID=A0A1R1X5X0_9FUNG|nr:hypothetical protein AYI70_g10590 [Smittium culicis]